MGYCYYRPYMFKTYTSVWERESLIDLICMPLRGIDVIVSMDWLMANNATLDCKKKLVTISMSTALVEMPRDSILMSAARVDKAIRKGCHAFAVFFSIDVDAKVGIDHIEVVNEYPEVSQRRCLVYLQSVKWSSLLS